MLHELIVRYNLMWMLWVYILHLYWINYRSRHGSDPMIVRITTTYMYAISVYHHWSCEFESHSGGEYSIQHYVIKFIS